MKPKRWSISALPQAPCQICDDHEEAQLCDHMQSNALFYYGRSTGVPWYEESFHTCQDDLLTISGDTELQLLTNFYETCKFHISTAQSTAVAAPYAVAAVRVGTERG